jgi:nitrite reductase/ring-hydroxylating ferredoxin subunit
MAAQTACKGKILPYVRRSIIIRDGLMALAKVASVNDLRDGECRVVAVNSEEIALFRIDGRFFATTNSCAHRGGPLGEGFLEGSVVTCPWHGWKFDVTTGVSANMPSVKVQTYRVHLQGNDVMVEV